MYFEVGDYVRKGETILELDNVLESLEVERRKLIAESKVDLESAASQLDALQQDLEEMQRLYEDTRSISRDEIQKRELDIILAKAEYGRLELAEAREEIE